MILKICTLLVFADSPDAYSTAVASCSEQMNKPERRISWSITVLVIRPALSCDPAVSHILFSHTFSQTPWPDNWYAYNDPSLQSWQWTSRDGFRH